MGNDPSGHMRNDEGIYYSGDDPNISFPNQLGLINSNINEKEHNWDLFRSGNRLTSYSQIYNDSRLEGVANKIMRSTLISPQDQPLEFAAFASKYIRNAYDYDSALGATQETGWLDRSMAITNEINAFRQEHPFLGSEINLSFQSSEQKVSNLRKEDDRIYSDRVIAKEKAWRNYWYDSGEIYDRLMSDRVICQDYALFTGYVLAKAGIPSAVGSSGIFEGGHAFNLIDVGGNPYIVDSTDPKQQVYAMSDYKYTNFTENWAFDTPWGGKYSVPLSHKREY